MSNVLLVFPSIFAKRNSSILTRILEKKVLHKDISIKKIAIEESCIVFRSNDVVESANTLCNIFGIDRVAVASMIKPEFNNIVTGICSIGRKTIMPNKTFYVKVLMDSKTIHNFVSRDIEFSATGNLTSDLSDRGSYPVKNEEDADQVISAYIGSKHAYVFLYIKKGPGGLIYGSQNKHIFGSIHNVQSAISLMLAIKSGFLPEILVLHYNDVVLKETLALFGNIISHIPEKKIRIRIAKVDFPEKIKPSIKNLLMDIVSSEMIISLSMSTNTKNIILPLCVALHPQSIIEDILKRAILKDRMPWMPSGILNEELFDFTKKLDFGNPEQIEKNILPISQTEILKYIHNIDRVSKKALDNIRVISLNIGPNYIHDIIDSI